MKRRRPLLLALLLLTLSAALLPQILSGALRLVAARRGYALEWREVGWSGASLEWSGLAVEGRRGRIALGRARVALLSREIELSEVDAELARRGARWPARINHAYLTPKGLGYALKGDLTLLASPDPRLEPFSRAIRGRIQRGLIELRLEGAPLRLQRGALSAQILGAIEARKQGGGWILTAHGVEAHQGSAWARLERVWRGARGGTLHVEGGRVALDASGARQERAPERASEAVGERALPEVRFEALQVEVTHPQLGAVTLYDLEGEVGGARLRAEGLLNEGRFTVEVKRGEGWRRPERARITLDEVALRLGEGATLALPGSGRASGFIEVKTIAPELTLKAALDLQLTLDHPALADRPLKQAPLHLDLEGQGRRARFSIDAIGRLGAVPFDLALSVSPEEVKIEGGLQPAPCQAGVEALASWLGPYAGAEAEGDLESRARIHVPLDDLYALRLWVEQPPSCVIKALNAEAAPPIRLARGALEGPADDVAWLKRPFILPVARAEGIEVGPGTSSYVPLKRLPAYVPAAMWVSEDLRFWGRRAPLDPWLLQRALKFNVSRGRFVYGGSTLPQQLVKNLFLTHGKRLDRKAQEALIAARVTQALTREEILELYINCIEFAPRVYGIRAAARHYFNKSPSMLTPNETVFLAMAKPSPRFADVIRRRGQTPDTAHHRLYFERIMGRMVARGFLSAAAMEASAPYALRF